MYIFLAIWSAGKPGADVNGNGVVDFDDLNMFFQIWMSVVSGSKPDGTNPA